MGYDPVVSKRAHGINQIASNTMNTFKITTKTTKAEMTQMLESLAVSNDELNQRIRILWGIVTVSLIWQLLF
jgi:hypothetical protein